MTKLFVSTKQTQGERPNDFSYVPEGELVTFAFECDNEQIDGSCGCRRSMGGVESSGATTTFRVEEVELDEIQLANQIFKGLEKGGWVGLMGGASAGRMAYEDARALIATAAQFEVGDIVEKRGDGFVLRRAADPEVEPEFAFRYF